jgi:hypothetical protein
VAVVWPRLSRVDGTAVVREMRLAVLRRVHRTATIRAAKPTTACALGAGAIVGAVTGQDVAAAVEGLVSERLGASPS